MCMAFPFDVEIRLRNKVCKAQLGCSVELKKLRETLPEKYTVRENFPGLVYRGSASWSSSTVLLFPNGSIIVTGADSDETIQNIVRDVAQDLRRLGYSPHQNIRLEVVNSVAQFRIRRPVDIVAFSRLVAGAKLDRTRFPAVTWRDPETGCTLRLFRNGAGVVLGAGDQSKIRAAVHNLYRLILRLGLVRTTRSSAQTTPRSPRGAGGGWPRPQSVDRALLMQLLDQLFGQSISKTIMRNLEALKGELAQYSFEDVGDVLTKLLGEYAAKGFLKKLAEHLDRGG